MKGILRGCQPGFRLWLAAVSCCAVASAALAAEEEHVILGKPLGGFPVKRIGYSCGYKAKVGCSIWVAYHLIQKAGLLAPGPEEYQPSAGLFPLTLFPHDNALGRSPECEKEVYSMVNIAASRGNDGMRKVWKETDDLIRGWARQYKEVWVITGPIFSAASPRTESGRAVVPDAFYKIVVRREGDGIKTVAFKIPQDFDGKPAHCLASIASIEKETDIEFLPALPADQRRAIKAVAPVMWNAPGGSTAGRPSRTAAPAGAAGPVRVEPAGEDQGAVPAAAGQVWVLTREGKYFRSDSKNYGKGDGTLMDEEAAASLGFRAAR
jgi:hypothetical protein